MSTELRVWAAANYTERARCPGFRMACRKVVVSERMCQMQALKTSVTAQRGKNV